MNQDLRPRQLSPDAHWVALVQPKKVSAVARAFEHLLSHSPTSQRAGSGPERGSNLPTATQQEVAKARAEPGHRYSQAAPCSLSPHPPTPIHNFRKKRLEGCEHSCVLRVGSGEKCNVWAGGWECLHIFFKL